MRGYEKVSEFWIEVSKNQVCPEKLLAISKAIQASKIHWFLNLSLIP